VAKILSQLVEVCVFRWKSRKPQYLLLQRSDNEKLYPGLWQIVSGTIKKNESADGAALRELDEETGLRIKRLWTVPFVDSYYDVWNDVVQMVPVFAVEVESDLTVQLSKEHQRFQWLSYTKAKGCIVWPGQQKAIEIMHEFINGGKEAARFLEITQF
jgi:dihydroneopterin triphosphate diphosphatase